MNLGRHPNVPTSGLDTTPIGPGKLVDTSTLFAAKPANGVFFFYILTTVTSETIVTFRYGGGYVFFPLPRN